MSYLLDTNIVTAHLKNSQRIKSKLEEVEKQGQEAFISCITYFEIKRGLLAVNAISKLSTFNEFCRKYRVILLDDLQIIEKAAEIHAALKHKGTPIQDADVLIAATAIIKGLIVISNDSDMLRVIGLTVENWLNIE